MQHPTGSAGAASFRALVSGDIPDEAVTYAKMQHAAANTILVRDAGNSIGDISAKAVADKEILFRRHSDYFCWFNECYIY